MSQQIAVVTGAGAGIGRAVVRMLAEAGCDLALIGRNEDRLADTVAELEGRHVRVKPYVCDVSDARGLEDVADRIEADLGPITLWVNAAGIAAVGPVSALEPEDIRRVMEVTYLGTVFGTQAALRQMRRRGRGRIVNLGMMPQLRGLPLQAANVAAHAGIEAFCASLRPELLKMKDRIDVAVVHLPSINTPRLGWGRNRTGHPLKPYGRVYEPEVAALAVAKAAFGRPRDVWVGFGGLVPALGATLLPGVRDRLLAGRGYRRQMGKGHVEGEEDNFSRSLAGAYAAHGAFEAVRYKDDRRSPFLMTPPMRAGIAAFALAAFAGLVRRVGRE